jgi:NAD(P)-dependent dehydrogenase (short-subunit alcohol dehydrogenase family)
MSKKTIIITGASDGIGAAAARLVSKTDCRLILVGRTKDKLEAVAQQAKADACFTADYESLADVERLAKEIRSGFERVDVLANNAGGLFSGPHKTIDGFERTLQVNHLAGFLLTHKLLDLLIDSKGAVINTSSIGARLFGHIDINDLNNWEHFSANKAYGDTKLANILFARGLHQRYHKQGLSAVAFHPGNVATNFASDTNSYFKWVYHSILKVFLISSEKGGKNLAYFINGTPNKDWQSGEFYSDHLKIGKTNLQAYDDDLVDKHWQRSAAMLKLDW